MVHKTYNICDYDLWDFIADNLPNYHQRDDVLYNDIVSRYVNGEDLDEKDLAMMKETFKSYTEAEKWLDNDIDRLFLEAFEEAYKNGDVYSITMK